MNTRNLLLASVVIALSSAVQPASASQPPDSVTSDANENTAMGGNALLDMTSGGFANTAAGYNALIHTTSGQQNTCLLYTSRCV